MNKILVISPHFDDAVLSAGQFMSERSDAEVVTVFGGFPKKPEDVHTPYDKKCGFDNAEDAVTIRRLENDEATALLGATAINLEFPDEQYGVKVELNKIIDSLQELVDNNDYEFIMGPLGLGHPDHILVTDAILRLNTELPIYLWEDLPLRVVEPELVWPRLQSFGFVLDNLINQTITNNISHKIRSLTCYKSQIGTGILDPYLMYVPERFWVYQ